jgi:hypothetical protein
MLSIRQSSEDSIRRSRSLICIRTSSLFEEEEGESQLIITPTMPESVRKVQDICNSCASPSGSVSTLSFPSVPSSITGSSSKALLPPSRKNTVKDAPWRKLTEFVNEHQKQEDDYTTVMIRHIPTKYIQSWLVEEIQATGNRCNFVHLPIAKKYDINLGYAFVNFVTPEEAQTFLASFQGHQFVKQPRSAKRAVVSFASLQGFQENVEFYNARRIANTKRAPWVLRD